MPGRQPMGLAHAPDRQSDDALLTPKALAADGPEAMPAMATAVVPPGQEGGFVGIAEAMAAAMPWLAFRKCRALEVALHGAPTEAHLLRDGVQRPPLLMIRPDLGRRGPTAGSAAGGPGWPRRSTTVAGRAAPRLARGRPSDRSDRAPA